MLMDVRRNDAKICNGNDSSSVVISKGRMHKGEEEYGETSLLLSPSLKKGEMKGRRQRSRRKKVQWNDLNGDKLVEVLEFQPSDSADSEDECEDSCICTIM